MWKGYQRISEVGARGYRQDEQRSIANLGSQIRTLLKKNVKLKLRSRRGFFGCGMGGIPGLMFELLLPTLVIILLSIPKIFLDPIQIPQLEAEDLYPIDNSLWVVSNCPNLKEEYSFCFDPRWFKKWSKGKVLYAPNSDAEKNIIDLLVKDISCPNDPTSAFTEVFWKSQNLNRPDTCILDKKACLANPECFEPLKSYFIGFDNEDEAISYAMNTTHTRAAIIFDELEDNIRYTLRMNHTMTPITVIKDDVFSLNPQMAVEYSRHYWFFSNLQLSIDRSLLAVGKEPYDMTVKMHQFPAPPYSINPDAIIAGAFIDLCLIVAFLLPLRASVVSIVSEKELRLHEGMKLLGVSEIAYWISWKITHFVQLSIMSAAMAMTATITFPESNVILLFFFFALITLSLIPLAYLISCFFQSTSIAGPSAVLLFTVAMIPGSISHIVSPYGGQIYSTAGLLAPSCVSLFGYVLRKLEFSGLGLRFSTLSTPITVDGSLTANSLILCLLIDTVLYTILFLYFRKVLPDEAGRRLPFYFLLTKKFWYGVFGKEEISDEGNARDTANTSLSIQHLTKKFKTISGKTLVAVNDLNINMNKSQVFGLLGHNGAGKTTIMSIITGLMRPTSGNVFVNDKSILRDMDVIRESLGLCPQFDILWPTLTVRDHLQFYAEIKGIPKKNVDDEIYEMASEVGLTNKLDCPSCELSGGQKRKLSVGMAFMGSPFLVVLDEPTSGVDPKSRRDMWDIIRRNRDNRVVILSTHFMDEAEILCDRIGIIHKGKMVSYGSSLDLKAKFGSGYVLNMILSEGDNQSQKVIDTIKNCIKSAKVIGSAASELSIQIGKEWIDSLPELAAKCEELETEGLIKSYGFSSTTLEDVFLHITRREERLRSQQIVEKNVEMIPSGHIPDEDLESSASSDLEMSRPLLNKSSEFPCEREKLHGIALLYQQMKTLFWKRYVCAKRERLTLVVQLLIPLLLVIAALSAGKASTDLPVFPKLKLDRHEIFAGRPVLFGADQKERISHEPEISKFEEVYRQSSLIDTNLTNLLDMDPYLLEEWYKGRSFRDMLFLEKFHNVSSMAPEISAVIGVNFTSLHALPTSVNALTSTVARYLNKSGIETSTQPLPVRATERAVKEYQYMFKFIFICCMCMAVSSLSASFAVFIVQERSSNSKQVQLVSGANTVIFWWSHFVWDMIMHMISVGGMILCFLAFQIPEFTGNNLPAVVLLLALYGCASIQATYAYQFLFQESFKAFVRLWTLFFLSGYLLFLVDWIFDMISGMSRTCRIIHNVIKWIIPALSPQFNVAKGLYNLQVNQSNPFNPFALPKSPFALHVTGYSMLFLLGQMVVFAVICLLVDYRFTVIRSGSESEVDNTGDEEGEDDRLLKANRLRKKYIHYMPPAVDNLSFHLKKNECFGLLGVNGAGKTTTFRMLTGEIKPSSGSISVCGYDMLKDRQTARRFMGYCPQYEAIIGNMTGRETLKMYALIRGTPAHLVDEDIQRIIAKLQLVEYADRLSKRYSGGNKRKLAVGAAIVGDPKIILLDEPSTGMDPLAKRFLWDVISEIYQKENRSVILTSHSMAECEALCSRIGIMVSGKFQCNGYIQELKSNFGAGYQVEFMFNDTLQLQKMVSYFNVRMPGASVIESTDLYCVFQIKKDVNLPLLFQVVKDSRNDVGFKAFSVNQTTLEQIFIQFASE